MKNNTPTLWRDMTPEEKGALLLAEHDGKVIEFWCFDRWDEIDRPSFDDYEAYRIKLEPKRETVTLYGGFDKSLERWSFGSVRRGRLILTLETEDGEPVPGTEKWEKQDG